MPALAPVLRDEDDDPLVLVERGTVLVALACWPVEAGPVDDSPEDDGSVVCISAMQQSVTQNSRIEIALGEPTSGNHTYRSRCREDDCESEEVESYPG